MSEQILPPEEFGTEPDPAQLEPNPTFREGARIDEYPGAEGVSIIPDDRALAVHYRERDVLPGAEMSIPTGSELMRLGLNSLAAYVQRRARQPVFAYGSPGALVERAVQPLEASTPDPEIGLRAARMVRSRGHGSGGSEATTPPRSPASDPTLHPSGLSPEAWERAEAEHAEMIKAAALEKAETNRAIREAQEAIHKKAMLRELHRREDRTLATVQALDRGAAPPPRRSAWERYVTDPGNKRKKKQ